MIIRIDVNTSPQSLRAASGGEAISGRSGATRMFALTILTAVPLLCAGQAPGPPEWYRRDKTLTPSLVAISTPQAEFTDVTSLDVDSRGNIYVADWYRAQITVLSPAGHLLRAIGRKGAGPGEFQSVRVVQILPDDSLLVYDPSLGRVTVFAPGARPAHYAVNFGSLVRRVPFEVRRTPNNRLYLARFRKGYASSTDPKTFRNRKDVVTAYRLDGALVRDSMLVFPSTEFLTTTYHGQFSITPHPFGEEGFWAALSSEFFYVVNSGEFLIRRVDTAGVTRDSFRIAFRPPELSPGEMRKALPDWSAQTWDKFGAVLSERAPVFPADFDLRLIRGNRAYGTATDSDGVPGIRIYSLAP